MDIYMITIPFGSAVIFCAAAAVTTSPVCAFTFLIRVVITMYFW